ncbi:hypothetical protein [Nocardiopsis alborubida]|uniref:Uncharacterized protein n=1 Tax=Nocardiopsis alborubida TaxID=146802 RepID=A0A7X6RRA6_9ACTN|nr:hypothetical protein [Nocardiopsis alborubida]NKY99026.1 hypothetical protein [Nocardiopsis alborubida]
MAQTPSPEPPDIVGLMVEAYRRADIGAHRISATGVRIPLPGAGPFDADYSEAVERAREYPAEQYPQMAEQTVLATMRRFREQGVLLGTHYPPRSDDHGRGALVAVFGRMGVEVRFETPRTLRLALPDGGHATTDVSAYLAEVENASEDGAFEEAGRFAETILRRMDQVREQPPASAERLRVRLYPGDAFPEGVLDGLVARELAPGLWQTVAVDLPDSVQPLSRRTHEESGRATEEVFAEAVARSVAEPVEVSEHEIDGVGIVHVGGQHLYVSAQVHVLDRHLGEAPHGALVALPVAQVVLAHPLGQAHPILAMERFQELAGRFAADADKPVTPQLYWWRPGSGTDLPRLSAVAVEVDHGAGSVALRTADPEFGPLLESLMRAGRA